ncbi:unnamed protein product, partial [Allacma fusca]
YAHPRGKYFLKKDSCSPELLAVKIPYLRLN